MKREGRQHGMVRSYRILPEPLNPRSKTRFIHKFDSPPTAGLFTKVSSNPTNHSKFTGKCGSPRWSCCHLQPACKSKDKVKGTQKNKSIFRVADERPGSQCFGFSATELVDHIYDDYYSEDEEEEEEEEEEVSEFYDGGNENGYSHGHEFEARTLSSVARDDDENGNRMAGDGVNVCISEIGLEIDRVEEDEGWYLVESIDDQ
ncbi:hypothetical protein L6164_008993 [Bauhinia variegata]|uniref:Uncharacterized protein n=1 Tax=Bauhinia variegata TaxID=167791 RepID=A0ACB9PIB1_BAUVA|nr:hypothetical protein L6164_008993 [Bauhinia variegata]